MPREHTIADLLNLMNLSGVAIDDIGEKIAVSVSRTYHEKKQPVDTSIFIYSASEQKLLNKFEDKNARKSNPCFNSDGSRIAFLEKASERNYLVINDLAEGTQEKLELDGEPHQIQWHGDTVLILKDEPVEAELKAKQEEGADGKFFEEEDKFSSLYLYKPGSGFRQLTKNLQVWEFSANGNKAALVASGTPQENSWYHSKLYGLDLADMVVRQLYDPGWRSLARPRISRDGSKVIFTESLWSDRGLGAGDLVIYRYSDGKTENVTRESDRSFSDMAWIDSESFSALWIKEGVFGVSEYHGKWEDLWQAKGTVLSGFSPELAYSGGRYAFAFTDESTAPEVYVLEKGKKAQAISSINAGLSDLQKYPAEIVKWKSGDGMEIHGILRSLGKDKPLIVNVHGGPTSASFISFLDRNTVFLGAGFSVFLPNYRGSIGAGRDYAEANRGDMGGKDFQDILDGIRHLKESGKLSTDNIFITGGSYGGFITSWAVTQTDIFKAAAGLFGISDWLSFHGTSNIPAWDQIHYDDDPYTGNLYTKFSPIKYVQNVKTPTILMHGINDPCVPVSQYYQFYRALKDLGKTVRLLLFPREGHGFSEKKHIEQSIEETISWFRKYVS